MISNYFNFLMYMLPTILLILPIMLCYMHGAGLKNSSHNCAQMFLYVSLINLHTLMDNDKVLHMI